MPSFTVDKDGQKKRLHGTQPPNGTYPVSPTAVEKPIKKATGQKSIPTDQGVNDDANR